VKKTVKEKTDSVANLKQKIFRLENTILKLENKFLKAEQKILELKAENKKLKSMTYEERLQMVRGQPEQGIPTDG
jgi:hypothetical protein